MSHWGTRCLTALCSLCHLCSRHLSRSSNTAISRMYQADGHTITRLWFIKSWFSKICYQEKAKNKNHPNVQASGVQTTTHGERPPRRATWDDPINPKRVLKTKTNEEAPRSAFHDREGHTLTECRAFNTLSIEEKTDCVLRKKTLFPLPRAQPRGKRMKDDRDVQQVRKRPPPDAPTQATAGRAAEIKLHVGLRNWGRIIQQDPPGRRVPPGTATRTASGLRDHGRPK